MRSQVATFVFAIVFGAETSAAHAQLLPRRDLSYSIAKTIAETAIESCTAGGYRVSAVVVDRDGETIVALHGDNASPHAMENARRKAYTALSLALSDKSGPMHHGMRLARQVGIPSEDQAMTVRHSASAAERLCL
jgi:uncharacterized protein GlcG (DUF336 family)